MIHIYICVRIMYVCMTRSGCLGVNFKLQPAVPHLNFLMVVLPFHSSVSKAEVQ